MLRRVVKGGKGVGVKFFLGGIDFFLDKALAQVYSAITRKFAHSGRSAGGAARVPWEHEVGGSNPPVPTRRTEHDRKRNSGCLLGDG